MQKMNVSAELGKLVLPSSQTLWLILNSAVAHIGAMAHRLKTSALAANLIGPFNIVLRFRYAMTNS